LDEKNPREHKKYGRMVKGYDQKVWDANKFNIVYNGNMLKFTQEPKLLFHLLSTGDRTLVEASPKDDIWGIFMDENEEGVDDPKNWKGENLLGYAITDVRNNIRKLLSSTNNLYSIYSKYANTD
jgi:hypothetical protein